MSGVFEMLARPIQKLLAERGFSEPTLPQREAIPKILDGKNVLLIAPAGTGKTESAFLPVLHQLLVSSGREPGIKVIYVTPLRALNRDMFERLQWWCRYLDLRVAVRHGDTDTRERRAQALIPPDIIVTTPESLQIFLLGKRLSRYLKSVRWVIIDEIHELAENKRGAQLAVTLERLRKTKGGDFQIIGLSATIGSPEEVAKFLVGVGRSCDTVDVSVAKKLELQVLYPKAGKRDEALAHKLYTFPEVAARLRVMRGLIESHGSTLVFTNTRPMAEILGSRFRLWDLKFPVGVHHGSLSSATRVRAERALKAGDLKGIICTSSMELGLDIGRVDLVVQYNSPRQVTRLLQRVGRSGHSISEVSKGAIVVQDPDDAMESMVITARSKSKELEPVSIPEKPLDVLLHSLVSVLLEKRGSSLEEQLETFKRAYPFRDLTRDDLGKVLDFAQSLERRILRRSGDGNSFMTAGKSEKLFEYYFGNLSMIPEFKQYLVVDDDKNQPVGVLDESFVAEHGEPKVKFVMGGEIWRIVQVFKNKVYVKSDDDPVGAIPTWVGEEIPVPFSVAQEVGRVRARFVGMVKSGKSPGEAIAELSRELRVEGETVERAIANVRQQMEEDNPVPTDDLVTVEQVKGMCVVNACFGTLVNRTLARLLVFKISTELGSSVATSIDPYRVILKSESLSPENVVNVLKGELSKNLTRDLRQIIEESRFFRWRLSQVARRMGVLEREAEITSSVLDKLVRALKGTPAFEEAFKEVIHRDLDLDGTLEVLEKIKQGKISIVSLGERKEPTPISAQALQQRYLTLEPMVSGRTKLLAMASAKARLLSETLTLACVECRDYVAERKVHEVEENPECPKCSSKKIGAVHDPEEGVRHAIELSERGRSTPLWKKLVESSKLVSKYGGTAVVAFAGREMTPAAASEILAKAPDVSSKFLELVLRKEREAVFRRFKWTG
jgi:ATP-dependent Lhr-like helicase